MMKTLTCLARHAEEYNNYVPLFYKYNWDRERKRERERERGEGEGKTDDIPSESRLYGSWKLPGSCIHTCTDRKKDTINILKTAAVFSDNNAPAGHLNHTVDSWSPLPPI